MPFALHLFILCSFVIMLTLGSVMLALDIQHSPFVTYHGEVVFNTTELVEFKNYICSPNITVNYLNTVTSPTTIYKYQIQAPRNYEFPFVYNECDSVTSKTEPIIMIIAGIIGMLFFGVWLIEEN